MQSIGLPRTGPPEFYLVIGEDQTDLDLYSTLGGAFTLPITLRLVILSGVRVSASAVGGHAVSSGGLPTGTTVEVYNYGEVLGAGGAGGAGGWGTVSYPSLSTSPTDQQGHGGGGGAGDVVGTGGAAGGPAASAGGDGGETTGGVAVDNFATGALGQAIAQSGEPGGDAFNLPGCDVRLFNETGIIRGGGGGGAGGQNPLSWVGPPSRGNFQMEAGDGGDAGQPGFAAYDDSDNEYSPVALGGAAGFAVRCASFEIIPWTGAVDPWNCVGPIGS